MLKYNPFNPQIPVRPAFFVGREPDIVEFERYLSQTIHGSPMNMSITGNRGMGKTSILVKFEQIAKKNGCLVLRLSNYEGNVTTVTDLADYICTNLKREMMFNQKFATDIQKFKEYMASIKPTFSYGEFGVTVEKREREQMLQDLLRTRLLKLWKTMKVEYKACVILIDEGESIERIEGGLIFLREVFQRLASDAKYMLAIAGKLNFPEKMSESFSPLNRFFPCSTLKPFNRNEIEKYVRNQLKEVKAGIDKEALMYIAEKSEGHPYVLASMCFMIFDSLEDANKEIDIHVIEKTKANMYSRLADDFFRPMLHPLTPKAKEVLISIASNIDGLTFKFSDAVKWSKLPSHYVSPYMQEMMRKGILNKLERGKYQIFHGLFIDYVREYVKETIITPLG